MTLRKLDVSSSDSNSVTQTQSNFYKNMTTWEHKENIIMNSSDSELHQSAIKGSSGSQSDSILWESGDSNKRNKFSSNFHVP